MTLWRRIAWRSWTGAPWLPVDGSPLRLGEALEMLHRDAVGNDWQHVRGHGGTYLEWRPYSASAEPVAAGIPSDAAGSSAPQPCRGQT